MDFIGFLAGLWLVFFPPAAVRDQINLHGEDVRAWLGERLPWHLKRIKSFLVGKALLLSAFLALATGAWLYTLNRLEPGLVWQDTVILTAGVVATVGQLFFAGWNFINGRLRFNQALPADPAWQSYAISLSALTESLAEQAAQAEQLLGAARTRANPLAPPSLALLTSAQGTAGLYNQLAQFSAATANAYRVIYRADVAMACMETLESCVEKMANILSIAPSDPILLNHFQQITQQCQLGEQAAAAADQAEGLRVSTIFGSTRMSLPHWWAGVTLASLLTLGVYTHIYAVSVEDRWLVVLSLIPLVMVFALARFSAEVLSWLVLKGTKLGEFLLTKASQLAVAVLPGDTLESVRGTIDINVLEEEKIAAAIKEWINVGAIMWLPYAAVVFWVCTPWVALAMLGLTLVASLFSLAYISRGKKEEVDESTTKTIGWFWKYGKYITFFAIFLGGASVEWSGLMNRLAGVTPILILDGDWKTYLLTALIAGVIAVALVWAMKALDVDWLNYVFKPAAALAAGVTLVCVLAPIARAANHGEPAIISLPQRHGPQAEPPVGISQPTVSYQAQGNGRERMVISFTTRARMAKGVVRFEPHVASALGLDVQDIPVQTFSGLEDCGGYRCRRHQIVIPEVKARPQGNYQVIMRNWLTTEAGPEYGL